jgi:hypothetical protein
MHHVTTREKILSSPIYHTSSPLVSSDSLSLCVRADSAIYHFIYTVLCFCEYDSRTRMILYTAVGHIDAFASQIAPNIRIFGIYNELLPCSAPGYNIYFYEEHRRFK